MRVLRVCHSDVVAAWRERDRQLRRLGVDVRVVCAASWEEGGGTVRFEPGEDYFAVGAGTLGRHPNLFLFDPRPIWRLLRSERFDLIDLHEEPFSLAAAELLVLRALSRRRAPYVVYSAQNLDKRYPPPFSWIERRVLAGASGAYPCNAAAGERLRRRGLRADSRVLPLGVDVEAMHPGLVARPAPSGALRVGYVGRLATHKGIEVLVHALAGLGGFQLELAGDGPDRAALLALAGSALAGRVSWVGVVTGPALAERYRSYDVLVVPSLPTPSWTEQFGRVAVEAMACGVPVVASDAGALPEVVGDAGVIVPAGDVEALRAALAALARDPGRWLELRERGLRRARRFCWPAVAAVQLELYEQACA